MDTRTQRMILGSLLVVLAIVVYFMYFRSDAVTTNVQASDERFTAVNVDSPALRLDVLQHFLSLEYKGGHRNIFSATLPPPPAPPASTVAPVNSGPVEPPPPPPLVVDAKYFGFVTDGSGQNRRAFFASNNNEDVIIASEGDTLLGRFRVVKLSSNSADVEEVSSGRRATLALEAGGPNG